MAINDFARDLCPVHYVGSHSGALHLRLNNIFFLDENSRRRGISLRPTCAENESDGDNGKKDNDNKLSICKCLIKENPGILFKRFHNYLFPSLLTEPT